MPRRWFDATETWLVLIVVVVAAVALLLLF